MAASCKQKKVDQTKATAVNTPTKQEVKLPAPYETKSVSNYCKVIGWPAGKMPVAPAGFRVNLFADSLRNPRNIYVGPNGDIFVCESNGLNTNIKAVGSALKNAVQAKDAGKMGSSNRITMFRDINHDGVPEAKYSFLTFCE